MFGRTNVNGGSVIKGALSGSIPSAPDPTLIISRTGKGLLTSIYAVDRTGSFGITNITIFVDGVKKIRKAIPTLEMLTLIVPYNSSLQIYATVSEARGVLATFSEGSHDLNEGIPKSSSYNLAAPPALSSVLSVSGKGMLEGITCSPGIQVNIDGVAIIVTGNTIYHATAMMLKFKSSLQIYAHTGWSAEYLLE